MKWTNVLAYEVNSGGGNVGVQRRLCREGRFGWLWPLDSFHITQQGFCTCVAFTKGSFLFFSFFITTETCKSQQEHKTYVYVFNLVLYALQTHASYSPGPEGIKVAFTSVFSKKKKNNNIEQVTDIQRHLEKVGNILRLYKALPGVL